MGFNLFEVYAKIVFDSTDFNKGINDATGKTENFTSKIGGLIETVAGVKAVSMAFDTVRDSIGDAVSRIDTLERFPRVMESMGFSAEQSAASTEKLRDGIMGLPTALDDIVKNAQNLTVLTGNLELATDTTLALNNAFLASGSTSSDASRGLTQYVQQLSKGSVDMQSWRTLQETMGYALKQTAEEMLGVGSTSLDLYDALKFGNVTFDDMNSKIIELSNRTGGFADMAQTAAGGIGTSWSNMGIAVTRGTAAIITSIDEGLSETRFGSIQKIIEDFGKGFESSLKLAAKAAEPVVANVEKIIPVLGIATTGFVAFKSAMAISSVVTAATTALNGMTVAQYALNAAMNANPIAWAASAVAVLTGSIIHLVKVSKEDAEATQELIGRKKELRAVTDDLNATIRKGEADIDTLASAEEHLKDVQQQRVKVFAEFTDVLENSPKKIVPYKNALDELDKQESELISMTESLRRTEENRATGLAMMAQKAADASESSANRIMTVAERQAEIVKQSEADEAAATERRMAKANELNMTLEGYEKLEDERAKAAEKRLESQQKIYDDLANAAVNAFDKIDTSSTVSLENATKNFEHNAKAVSDWGENLRIAAERGADPLLIQYFVDLGVESEGTAALLAKFANSSEKEFEKFQNAAVGSFDAAVKSARDTTAAMSGIGADIVNGLASGILRNISIAEKAAAEMSKAVINRTRVVFDTHSPSKLFRDEIGAMLPEGLALGMSDGTPKAVKAAEKLAKEVYDKSKLWIEDYRYDTEYMASEEMAMWEYLLTQYDSLSKERVEIEKNITRLQKEEIKERENAEKEYQKAREATLKEIEKIEDDYTKSVQNRSQTIYNSFGFLDELAKKENLTTQDIMKGFDTQLSSMGNWADNMAELARKGIDEGIIAEIAKQGAAGSPLAEALTHMTDLQVQFLNEDYRNAWGLAGSIATDELSKMRTDYDAQIAELEKNLTNSSEKFGNVGELVIDVITGEIISGEEAVTSAVSGVMQSVSDAALEAIQGVEVDAFGIGEDIALTADDGLVSAQADLFDTALNTGYDAVDNLALGIEQNETIFEKITNQIDKMLESFDNRMQEFFTVGVSVSNNIAEGITSGAGAIADAVQSAISSAIASATSAMSVGGGSIADLESERRWRENYRETSAAIASTPEFQAKFGTGAQTQGAINHLTMNIHAVAQTPAQLFSEGEAFLERMRFA